MPHITRADGVTDARVEVQEPIEAGVSPQERPGEDRPNVAGLSEQDEAAEQDPYTDFTKDDLVAELERRGLPKSGNKDELVARLTEDDAKTEE